MKTLKAKIQAQIKSLEYFKKQEPSFSERLNNAFISGLKRTLKNQ